MKNLILAIILCVLCFSCGGSDDDSRFASVAETSYTPAERSDDDDNSTDNMMMRGNCNPPNLKLDVKVNRDYCGSDDCLIQFAGYWWWTNYQYTGSPNWFWNQGQPWSLSILL